MLLIGITVSFDAKRSKELGLTMVCVLVSAPVAVGVFVSIAVTGKSGYTGVGLNPSRCLGPAVFEGGLLWDDQWVFWAGPFAACIVYHLLRKAFPKDKEGLVAENDILKSNGCCFRGAYNTPNTHIQK